MIKSIYAEYIDRILPSFSKVSEKVNGKKKPLTYLHKTMLRNVHSTDKKWESASLNNIYVAADVVAMDSPLPIKSRPVVAAANGKLPKVGMLKQMKESDINDVDNLIQRNANFAEIARRFTDDVFACSVGIDEKNEYNFLYGFSRGYVLVEDQDNTGAGMRVNYGYLAKNSFGVAKQNHVSREDIERVIRHADADGVAIDHIAISQALYRKMRNEQWAKELVANYRGMTYTAETNLPVPSSSIFNEAFADEFNGIEFLVIDRTVLLEKNGKPFPVKPFADDRMVFYSGTQVGALVWGDLAEASHNVKQATYTTIEQYKLIARFAETNPLREFTSGQALVLPVIEGIESIYTIDTKISQPIDDDDEGEGGKDDKITLFSHRYLKEEVLSAALTVGIQMTMGDTDEDLIEAINSLSQAKLAKFKKSLEAYSYFPELSVSAMEMKAAGESKECTVGTNATGAVTATVPDTVDWLTLAVTGKKVTVTAAANTGEGAAAREAEVTVTAGGKSAVIAVSQLA